MTNQNARRGFTLIELLVVVLIIAILAAVALPKYQLAVEKSRYATLKNYVSLLDDSIQRYYLEHSTWPTDIGQLDVTLPGKYMWGTNIFLPLSTYRNFRVDNIEMMCYNSVR